ncbi:MAG: hypothetical protein ACK56F_32465, partial [bacterium]
SSSCTLLLAKTQKLKPIGSPANSPKPASPPASSPPKAKPTAPLAATSAVQTIRRHSNCGNSSAKWWEGRECDCWLGSNYTL